MANEKNLSNEKLEEVAGGGTEEEYYAEHEKFGLIDDESHRLEGTTCRDCGCGKLKFWRYQPGPFGNKEAVYYCQTCHEYVITVLRK